MKTIIITLAAATSLMAQTPDALEPDRVALRALGARYEKAINEMNLNALADSVLPDASAVFMTNDEVKGLPAMQTFIDSIKKRLGEGTTYRVKLNPDDTDFHGDIAIAHGMSDESVTFGNGKSISYVTKWTAVLKKADGAWKAARLHVSLDPISNPIVAMQATMRTWIAGGVGLLVGAAGFWLFRKLRRA